MRRALERSRTGNMPSYQRDPSEHERSGRRGVYNDDEDKCLHLFFACN